ncbi:MAG: transposase [Phycisphaerae bacterium]|nr:transposase [Phycisphaerae bacterium]
MGKPKRITKGGYLYHVMNRANGKLRIFRKSGDFAAFENILATGLGRYDMRICGYCIMGNHWHLLLWPRNDGDLSEFMRWVGVTHTNRWHAAHGTTGMGHIYQGPFKSFPLKRDRHYLSVLRYIEANPFRASLAQQSCQWPYSSLAKRMGFAENDIDLTAGPIPLPHNWSDRVLQFADYERATDEIRKCIKRGRPFGDKQWVEKTAIKLQLESTLKPRGRPKKIQK